MQHEKALYLVFQALNDGLKMSHENMRKAIDAKSYEAATNVEQDMARKLSDRVAEALTSAGLTIVPVEPTEGKCWQPTSQELHYLRSILRQLQAAKDVLAKADNGLGPTLMGEVAADNINWLDCFVDQHDRAMIKAGASND